MPSTDMRLGLNPISEGAEVRVERGNKRRSNWRCMTLGLDPFDRFDAIQPFVERGHLRDARGFGDCHQVGLRVIQFLQFVEIKAEQQNIVVRCDYGVHSEE